jgi:AraC-like DNA-binding protein
MRPQSKILPLIRHERAMHRPASGAVTRSIAQRAGIGATGHVIQRRDVLLAHLVIDQPVLIVIQRGQKVLAKDGVETRLNPGDAVAIAGGTVYDVINRPDPDGIYEAHWLAMAPDLIDRFAAASTSSVITGHLALRKLPADFRDAFDRAAAGIAATDLPDLVAAQRVQEMLAWIDHGGAHLANLNAPNTTHRLRALLAGAPAKDWTAPEIARALGMSEATLRRRLADEKTSLTAELTDLRMSLALTLLQVTDKAVGEIAHDVGYESPSRFATRFRARFGISPSDIRTAD